MNINLIGGTNSQISNSNIQSSKTNELETNSAKAEFAITEVDKRSKGDNYGTGGI